MLFLLSFDLVIRLSIGCWAKEEKEVQFPAAIEMCIAAVANRIGDLIVDPSDPAFLRHSPPLHTFFSSLSFVARVRSFSTAFGLGGS